MTDGTSFWVVDGTALKVFKYTLSGSSLGSWAIDPANTHPTGITINPTNVSDIWIVDNGTDKVYQYIGAASRTSGSQNAGATFALAAGNTNPQGIADPPPADMLLTPTASRYGVVSDHAITPQASLTDEPIGGNGGDLTTGGSGAGAPGGGFVVGMDPPTGGFAALATALPSSGEPVAFTGGGSDGEGGAAKDSADAFAAFLPGGLTPAVGGRPFLGDLAARPSASDGPAEWSPSDLAFLQPFDAL